MKVKLVFWIAPTHVELKILYTKFSIILLYRNPFELADVVLRPYCRCLSENCDDFIIGNARVQHFRISNSESMVLDNRDPGFYCEALQ